MADFQGYIILFLVWLVSTILVRAIFRKTRTASHLPPSPLALPIIGHLHLLSPIPHQALHKLSTRYGPLIHLFLGSVPCVVASSPEMAKEFLKTHETSFCDRPYSTAVDYLTYGSADFSFTPYGPYWKFMKKLCMTELLGGRTLNQFVPIRSEEIRRFMQFMLPYLQAIVKETLRLHPTGPMIIRESTETCAINGYEIPAKTTVFINVWALGRDPNHWENPLEFRPERFIVKDGKSQLDVRGQHFHFLPFGSGRRACPGTSLALYVVHATLAAMIQCFEWKVSGGNGSVDMEEGPGLTLPRAHPLICVPVISTINPFSK